MHLRRLYIFIITIKLRKVLYDTSLSTSKITAVLYAVYCSSRYSGQFTNILRAYKCYKIHGIWLCVRIMAFDNKILQMCCSSCVNDLSKLSWVLLRVRSARFCWPGDKFFK